MKRADFTGLAVMLAFSGALCAQENASPPNEAAAPATTPGTSNPAPSTSRTEGTAADRTPPGATPTRKADPGTVNPMPATSPTEGTAADRSPPGETPVRGTAANKAPPAVTTHLAAADSMAGERRASRMMGAGVFSKKGALLGEVKDLVVDPSRGDVTHAIIATGGSVTGGAQRLSAVPWAKIQSSMQNDRIMLDESRLNGAPSFPMSSWPDFKSRDWSDDVDQYWRAGRNDSTAQ